MPKGVQVRATMMIASARVLVVGAGAAMEYARDKATSRCRAYCQGFEEWLAAGWSVGVELARRIHVCVAFSVFKLSYQAWSNIQLVV